MATAIKQIGLGKVDRLTLLDPGTKVNDYEVNGKIQQGLIHKVKILFRHNRKSRCYHVKMSILLPAYQRL